MGAAEPAAGFGVDSEGAGIRKKQIFASNTGKCMERSYPEGSLLLNVGGGSIHWNGWINVDLDTEHADVVCDIRHLEFDENSVDAIAAIHVVEHIYRWDVDPMLKNWYQVLKPGGELIIELPSMEKVFSYIANSMMSKTPFSPTFSWFPLWGDPKYRDEGMIHRWGYTYPMLSQDLIKAGFKNIKAHKPLYHFPNRDMRVVAIK